MMIAWEDWQPFATYEPQCGNCREYDKGPSTCTRSGRIVKPTGLCEHHEYQRKAI